MKTKPGTSQMTGYEKVAHLMTHHAEMAMFQRFDFLNTLNALYLQAELVHLQRKMKGYLSSGFRPATSTVASNNQSGIALGIELHSVQHAEACNNANSGTEHAVATTIIAREARMSEEGQIQEKDIADAVGSGGPAVEGIAKGIERPGSRLEAEARSGTSSMSSIGLPDPARDWWDLANAEEDTEEAEAWRTMLETRAKLKEYNETLLLQKQLRTGASPNSSDLAFVRRWFIDEKMGDDPLIGQDRELWETSSRSDLITLKPRRSDDPLAAFFLKRVFIWWHHCLGHRVKKPADEEANYFEYRDKNVLRVADCLSSIISSMLLVVSILVLYFVNSMLARLGIVAAFTMLFSLTLTLVTNARKAEVFAGTAA
ncbi:uncharacterized protein K444DRAFT_668062 [Hyaloscypha bicolor E]|uniref:DUF6594 domain-containing protein n=1 Tax=Hyaloscypha bicolor E TaxID=1095630 RepID=A0A2J6SRN3_9HELO|nr:uncharacterized protein K444DRAFT_668062 [Hyaloscypha bicolor E]PMD53448.1 hypothetical protein K444DRAFT_668062 [Hyaloscypha bicolor E]